MREDEKVVWFFRGAVESVRRLGERLGSSQTGAQTPATGGLSNTDSLAIIEHETQLLKARRELCAELAKKETYWKIALAVAQAELRGETPLVKAVVLATGLAMTTTVRTLDAMKQEGLVEKTQRNDDRRAVEITLTRKSWEALDRWIEYRRN